MAGLGVAVVSRRAVATEVQSGRLKALRVAGLPLTRGLFVVRDRRRAVPTAARLLLDLCPPTITGS